jgi:hypothetical protein
MSLTPPAPRESLHTRSVVARAFAATTASSIVEARLLDTKTHAYPLMTGVRAAGRSCARHADRVTIDRAYTIHAGRGDDARRAVSGRLRRDRGRVRRSSSARTSRKAFAASVKDKLGGVRGCSHLTELVGHLPTAAVQMFASLVPEDDGRHKPFQLDRCHALESHGDTVRRWYPKWYRGAAIQGDR